SSYDHHILPTRRSSDLARPNNPTGTLWPSSLVAELAAALPDVLVVSDEAYAAYAGDGMVARTAELPNLVVMQTLSKIGLAALRVDRKSTRLNSSHVKIS